MPCDMTCRSVACVAWHAWRVQAARRFASVMTRGFPRYGCSVKTEKTRVNFKVAISRRRRSSSSASASSTTSNSKTPPTETVYLPQLPNNTTWLRWCGLRVHTRTLHVMADYSRFIGDASTDPSGSGGGQFACLLSHRAVISASHIPPYFVPDCRHVWPLWIAAAGNGVTLRDTVSLRHRGAYVDACARRSPNWH